MKHLPTLPDAVANICGSAGAPHLAGVVEFYQKRNAVLVVARITGLPSTNPTGFFAMHIHAGTSCGGTDFVDTGGHYNPTAQPHPRHAGDLPPLLYCNAGAYLAVLSDRFTVRDVMGRTVVIHGGADDFFTQSAGNSGAKIGCGEIRPVARR